MKMIELTHFLLLALLFGGCQHHRPLVQAEPCLGMAGAENLQAIVVTAKGSMASSDVAIRRYERHETGWTEVGKQIDGVSGTGGIAPPGEKREGDGRTPSGAFTLERAFGYDRFETKMPYIVVDENSVWIDDPKSPRYNLLATRAQADGASHEVMKRKDGLYKYGIVIEYNTKQVVPGAGSAIFFHIWRGPATSTAGCIAMSEEDMITLLQWLDPSRKPVTIIGLCPPFASGNPDAGKSGYPLEGQRPSRP